LRDLQHFKFKKLNYNDKKIKPIKLPTMPNIKMPKNNNMDRVFNVAKGSPSVKLGKKMNPKGIVPKKSLNAFTSLKIRKGKNPRQNDNFKEQLKQKQIFAKNSRFEDSLKVGNKTKSKNTNFMKAVSSEFSGKGMSRIKQQKGLNPFKDFDNDGVPNALDCVPKNAKLQGPEQTIEDKLNPSEDLRTNFQETTPDNNGQSFDINEPAQDDLEFKGQSFKIEEPKQQEVELKTGQQFSITEAEQEPTSVTMREQPKKQKLLQVIGGAVQRKFQDDIAQRQREREQNKIFQQEVSAESAKRARREQVRRLAKARPVPRRQPSISGTAKDITQFKSGFGGFGISQQGLAIATGAGQESRAQKLLRLLGKAQPVQSQPQVQQQPQKQGYDTQQIQAAPGQTVLSPHSKRRVSYIRGPYKKRSE